MGCRPKIILVKHLFDMFCTSLQAAALLGTFVSLYSANSCTCLIVDQTFSSPKFQLEGRVQRAGSPTLKQSFRCMVDSWEVAVYYSIIDQIKEFVITNSQLHISDVYVSASARSASFIAGPHLVCTASSLRPASFYCVKP